MTPQQEIDEKEIIRPLIKITGDRKTALKAANFIFNHLGYPRMKDPLK